MRHPVAKRLRLLIYEGSQAQLDLQRLHDGVRPGTTSIMARKDCPLTITSIDLDPTRMTLRDLARLFWTEIKHRANEGTLWPQ